MEDTPRLGQLAQSRFKDQQIDWSACEPDGWILAELDGEVMSAIQVCPMKPIGVVEHWVVDESLSHRERFRVLGSLAHAAFDVLDSAGCQAAACFVQFELKTMKKMLKKYFKGDVVASGNQILLKRWK